MPSTSSSLQDLAQALKKVLVGEVRLDPVTRRLYATDASIYCMEPLGVIFPKTVDDLAAAVEVCAQYPVPILARGAGSSLAGQAIGPAMILDCSRYLNHVLEMDAEARTALVEPGVVLAALNRQAARHGLQFGPDPASAERATLGGSLANNASGAHSIRYGMAADHLLSADVVFADGSIARLESQSLEGIERRLQEAAFASSRLGQVYAAALRIRNEQAQEIQAHWPRTWRAASGYGLHRLLPWSPARPPQWEGDAYPPAAEGDLNLAPLLAGSEGTLAVLRRCLLRLVPLPTQTVLGVLSYGSIGEACDDVPRLLELGPSAVELIPEALIRMARSVPAYAHQLGWIEHWGGETPAALLVVEFAGSDLGQLRQSVGRLGSQALVAESVALQRQVWGVRKVGLGILMSTPGSRKPWAFIEDLAVPVESLGAFVRQIERILQEHGTQGEIYAHASAGCLHIRPLLDLQTVPGVAALRAIAQEAVSLTLRLGGSVSGEHGDGLARSEWLERMFGAGMMASFRDLKRAFDPQGLLNPGKILDAPPMDTHLRYQDYSFRLDWTPQFAYPLTQDKSRGFAEAVEQCNGAGVCRKEEGVMCPSFQATGEEMHSTRGRANLLRALYSGRFPSSEMGERAVYEALDLCLACKGCKSECPSSVDMAKLKYEFLQHYYEGHARRLRDYLFGYIGYFAAIGQPFSFLLNPLLHSRPVQWLAERGFGLSAKRPFPHFAERSLIEQSRPMLRQAKTTGERVLLLVDAFTDYFYPQAGLATLQALLDCNCRVTILPVMGAGRTFLSKGMLMQARSHAQRLVQAVARLDPQGEACVVGIEPSEILTLRDEYPDLLECGTLPQRAWMIDEYLMRPGQEGQARIEAVVRRGAAVQAGAGRRVLLHGHCYQKAQPPAPDGFPVGVAATVAMLEAAGYAVEVISSGCCGMAGAFGYEQEHFSISQKVAELALLPAVRAAAPDTLIAASGVSCQAQIEDGAGRTTVHPIRLIRRIGE